MGQNNRKVDLLTQGEGGGLVWSQMSSLGHFHALGGGGWAEKGGGISIATVKSPAVMFGLR